MKLSSISGRAHAPGIAMGRIWKVTEKERTFPHTRIGKTETTHELDRFKKTLSLSQTQLKNIQNRLCRFQSEEHVAILESHLLLMKDPTLYKKLENYILCEKINAEWALEKTRDDFRKQFLQMIPETFQERVGDIESVIDRLLQNLMEDVRFDWKEIPPGEWIVFSDDFSPADIGHLPKDRVVGILTSQGGPTSHTLIIARSLNLPSIVGILPEDVKKIEHQAPSILDGYEGKLLLHPTPAETKTSRDCLQKQQALTLLLLKESRKQALTRNKISIYIHANIEWLREIPDALNHGAEGIGLLRTEYFYLEKSTPPSEEEHFGFYQKVLKQMESKMVTIRTLDIPEEKLLENPHPNPALGIRGFRWSLQEPKLLETQFRALLRASRAGNLRILLPMIASLEEFLEAKKMFSKWSQKLGIPIPPLGIMLEVPSAALTVDILAQEVDFFAVGTNDLIQYSLAVDRENEQLNQMYTPYHPAILRLLKQIADGVEATQTPVSVCGELAGDPQYLPLLIGAGIRNLSMNAFSIPLAKNRVRKMDTEECRALFEELLRCKTAPELEGRLRTFNNKLS